MDLNFTIKDKNKIYKIPDYGTEFSAGLDLYASTEDEIIIESGEFKLIDTNIIVEIPEGYEGQVRSKSGLALKNGLFVLNGIGTIDSDYRGSIGVILANFSKENYIVKPLQKIAQLIINKFEKVNLKIKDELTETKRKDGGFGSTGI